MNSIDWKEKLNSCLTPGRQYFSLFCLIVLFTILLAHGINRPFGSLGGELNSFFGIGSWNWLIHGPINLKFGMLSPFQHPFGPPSEFMTHHPPSLVIAPTAFMYWLFGIGEWQTRVSSIIFSILSLVVFWVLIARIFKTPWLTLISSLFYALFPMSVFYGGLFTHDIMALFFILALILTVILFEQEKQRRYLIGICAITLFGGLSDWPFFLVAVAAWLYIAFAKNYPQKKTLLMLMPGVLAISFSITLIQIRILSNTNPFVHLIDVFAFLNTKVNPGGFLHALFVFFNMRLNFDFVGFSEVGLTLAVIGAISYFVTNKKDKAKILFLLLLASPGLLTYLVLWEHSADNQFYGLYIMPAIAFTAAWGMGRLRNIFIASIVSLLFFISSLWYINFLFLYTQFSSDDFTLFKRVNAVIAPSIPICTESQNAKFYLFPREKIDEPPCSSDYIYFVMIQPQSRRNIKLPFSLTQAFYTNDFWQNLRTISFAPAIGIEIIKSIPLFKQKLEALLIGHDPRKDREDDARRAQAVLDEYNLRPVDCSTNYCLYKKM